MTKQQIKDALDLCTSVTNHDCDQCPYDKYPGCRSVLMGDASNIITVEEDQPTDDQKQEITDYKRTIKVLLDRIEQLEAKE